MKLKKVIFSLIETLLFNIIVYYIFYKIQPNQNIYLELNPHPLLFLCAAIGLRYGNYLGIVSSFISSAFYISVFYRVNKDISLLFLYFSNYKYILFFFWSSIVLGIFKDNFVSKVEKLQDENHLMKNQYDRLYKKFNISEKIRGELKKQIVGSEESILNLYEIASRLNTLDPEEVYTETIGILSKYLKAKKVSIYSYNEGSIYLRPKIKMGYVIDDNNSIVISEYTGYQTLIKEKKAIRWSDIKEERFPLMAAPIIMDNKVVAVVNIEDMDFDKMSEYAFQLFRLIIDWVNASLDKAMYVDLLMNSKFIDNTRFLKYDAFIKRLDDEKRRKEQFGMDYVLLKYKVQNISIHELDEKIKKLVRTVDIVSYNPTEGKLYILYPATNKNSISIIEKRIKESLNNKAQRVY